MRTHLVRATAMLVVLPATVACFGTGVVNMKTGISTTERVRECRALDAKVTGHGTLAAAGTILSAGTGLAAALPDKPSARQWVGAVSLASGVFGAVTSYLSQRNNDRFTSRHCELVLGPDFDQQYFRASVAFERDPVLGPLLRQRFIDSLNTAAQKSQAKSDSAAMVKPATP